MLFNLDHTSWTMKSKLSFIAALLAIVASVCAVTPAFADDGDPQEPMPKQLRP